MGHPTFCQVPEAIGLSQNLFCLCAGPSNYRRVPSQGKGLLVIWRVPAFRASTVPEWAPEAAYQMYGQGGKQACQHQGAGQQEGEPEGGRAGEDLRVRGRRLPNHLAHPARIQRGCHQAKAEKPAPGKEPERRWFRGKLRRVQPVLDLARPLRFL